MKLLLIFLCFWGLLLRQPNAMPLPLTEDNLGAPHTEEGGNERLQAGIGRRDRPKASDGVSLDPIKVLKNEHRKTGVPNPAVGLPSGCLTYVQRYRQQHFRGLGHSSIANALHPHSRFVVVLKLHQAHRYKMPLDAILNLRALATEVTQSGYHFYILYQVPTRDFYATSEVESTQLTREEMLEYLPIDLRPFVILHDFEVDLASYPALTKQDADYNMHPTLLWGPGPRAAYVAMSKFMHRYQAYQYAWVVEFDARWLGSSWGEVLNSALDLGRQATMDEISKDPHRMVPMDRLASRQLPEDTTGLPDLLAINGIRETDKWKHFVHNMNNATQLWEMPAIIYFGSRRFWDAVHEYATKGVGGHIEIFLPTVAMQRGMKAVGIPLPHPPELAETYHCCTKDAGIVYSGWYNRSEECSPSYLIHPVKLREEFWPEATLSIEE